MYTGEKIQVYTAVDRMGAQPDFEIALHPRCTHDYLTENTYLALAAGPGAW